jgi:hypothetical protein
MVYFFLNNLIGQAMYTAMYIVAFRVLPIPLYRVGPGSGMMTNGLWVMVMLEMTAMGLRNPDAETYLCLCPCAIKAKWMPWLFFCLFSVFSFRPAFDILAGILLGYLHMKTKVLDWTVISDGATHRIENWIIFTWTKLFNNYITLAGSTGEESGNA